MVAGNFLLIANGTPEELARARRILDLSSARFEPEKCQS